MAFIGLCLGLAINFLIIDTFEIVSFSSKVWCTVICAAISAMLVAPQNKEE